MRGLILSEILRGSTLKPKTERTQKACEGSGPGGTVWSTITDNLNSSIICCTHSWHPSASNTCFCRGGDAKTACRSGSRTTHACTHTRKRWPSTTTSVDTNTETRKQSEEERVGGGWAAKWERVWWNERDRRERELKRERVWPEPHSTSADEQPCGTEASTGAGRAWQERGAEAREKTEDGELS